MTDHNLRSSKPALSRADTEDLNHEKAGGAFHKTLESRRSGAAVILKQKSGILGLLRACATRCYA